MHALTHSLTTKAIPSMEHFLLLKVACAVVQEVMIGQSNGFVEEGLDGD